MDSSRYNAVIVGQTGVGKSTLINYLYGQKIANVGIGKPVTKNGFHPIDFEINGLAVTLFDSWGLEVGKMDQWLLELKEEFKCRDVDQPADKWFHSVFYCIQAGGHRIQECDIKIIKTFKEQNYKISVILTKCDQVSEEVENELKKELQALVGGVSVISICSEEKKTRSGTSQPFGKEDIERQAFSDFFDSLIIRLPLRCKSIMTHKLDDWERKTISTTKEDMSFAGFNSGDAYPKIKDSAEKCQHELHGMANKEIRKTLKMYKNFADRLGYPPYDFNNSDSSNSYFDRQVNSNDLNWYEIPLAIVLSPFVIMYGLIAGKADAIKETNQYIDQCKNGLIKHINSQTSEITQMLLSCKSKAIRKIHH